MSEGNHEVGHVEEGGKTGSAGARIFFRLLALPLLLIGIGAATPHGGSAPVGGGHAGIQGGEHAGGHGGGGAPVTHHPEADHKKHDKHEEKPEEPKEKGAHDEAPAPDHGAGH